MCRHFSRENPAADGRDVNKTKEKNTGNRDFRNDLTPSPDFSRIPLKANKTVAEIAFSFVI